MAENYTIAAGRAISDKDVSSHARVIDIGQTVASDLFTSGENPIGQTVQLGSANFTVVGLLAAKGSTGLQDADAVAIAPYTAVQDVLTGYSQSFSQLIVQGRSADTLNLAQSEVESILASANDTTVADLPFRVLVGSCPAFCPRPPDPTHDPGGSAGYVAEHRRAHQHHERRGEQHQQHVQIADDEQGVGCRHGGRAHRRLNCRTRPSICSAGTCA